jgi:hypothetical protein
VLVYIGWEKDGGRTEEIGGGMGMGRMIEDVGC